MTMIEKRISYFLLFWGIAFCVTMLIAFDLNRGLKFLLVMSIIVFLNLVHAVHDSVSPPSYCCDDTESEGDSSQENATCVPDSQTTKETFENTNNQSDDLENINS